MAKARKKTTRPPTRSGASSKCSDESAKASTSHSGVPALELIDRIRAKEISPATLDPSTRRECVQVLAIRGLNCSEIAKVFEVCDRTIRRDLRAIREHHAADVVGGGVHAIIGVLMCDLAWGQDQLKRTCSRSNARDGDRIRAVEVYLQERHRVIDRLQSLGVLPTAPRRVEATVRGQSDEVPSIEELAEEMAALEPEHLDDGGTGAVKSAVTMLAQLAGAEAVNAARTKRSGSGRDADQDAA